MPKFSIVIPLYNKEKAIARTLESVFAQTFDDYEVLVVNDGTTDNSEAVVRTFKNNKLRLISQENAGAAAARNTGIAHANGKFIAFLDADDLWNPDYLKKQAKAIAKFPNHGVFATAIYVENQRKKPQPAVYNFQLPTAPTPLDYFENSLKRSIIHTSAVVIKKEVFDQVGIFDTSIKSGEDTDLWIRIGLHHQIVFTSEMLSTYTYNAGSLSYRPIALEQRLNFKKFEKEEMHHKALKKFLDLNRFSLALLAKESGNTTDFKQLIAALDKTNLNSKQNFLLKLPGFGIRWMRKIKRASEKVGIRLSPF